MDWDAIFGGIISGLLGTGIWWVGTYLIKEFRNYRAKMIFGSDADRDSEKKFNLVYAEFVLRSDIKRLINSVKFVRPRLEYQKPNNQINIISIDSPISKCEVIASNYLNSNLFSQYNIKTEILSDIRFLDLQDNDKSIISFGGSGSNNVTDYILKDENNIFGDVEAINLKLGEEDPQNAYGYILRIRPKQFNKRVWIICAGTGEQGSSGAAWYLANRYNELLKLVYYWDEVPDVFNGGNFVAFVKVKYGHDDSASIIKLIKENTYSFISENKLVNIDLDENNYKKLYNSVVG